MIIFCEMMLIFMIVTPINLIFGWLIGNGLVIDTLTLRNFIIFFFGD